MSGIARAVAGCIARHANDKTGLGWPGMGTIVNETGFCRTAVVKAIKELERGGHVTVGRFKVGKKNTANRYQLPPMGGAPGGLVGGGGSAPHALPSAPDGLGGSAPDGPESVSKESVQESVSSSRARAVCKICGNDWPAEYGTTCYQCPQPTASQRRRRAQEKRNEETAAEFERELLGGTPTDDKPKADVPACTCGRRLQPDAYAAPVCGVQGQSLAQRSVTRFERNTVAGGANDRGSEDGGVVARTAGPGIDAPPLEAVASTPTVRGD